MRPIICHTTEIPHQRAVVLTQTGYDRFTVTYGHEEKKGLSYTDAATQYGSCVMHALACAHKIRTKNVSQEDGECWA